MNDIKGLSAVEILELIVRNDVPRGCCTYIIMGRSGPTGKTWLRRELNVKGFTAFEITEDILDFVDCNDNENHFRIKGDYAVIILNRILPHFADRFV